MLATNYANQTSVQATNNFNLQTVQVGRVRAELLASQAAGFAAAAPAAFQNKADSDAKAAECCCALKALILAQGEATRAQAADFHMRDLESRLAATRRLLPADRSPLKMRSVSSVSAVHVAPGQGAASQLRSRAAVWVTAQR